MRQLERDQIQTHRKIMIGSFAKRICIADNSASTANQLYRHRKHHQLVVVVVVVVLVVGVVIVVVVVVVVVLVVQE